MMYLCSVVSELSKYHICQSVLSAYRQWVGLFLDTGVISIGDEIQANKCLLFAEIKGCQVR